MTDQPHYGMRHRLASVRAVTRMAIALTAAGLTALLLPRSVQSEMRLVASWDGFAAIALSLTWTTILTLRPKQIEKLAQREDPSRVVALVLVVLGASASLLGVVLLLQAAKTMTVGQKVPAVVLALSAVVLGWFLIHTVFTLRYAHLYYDGPDGAHALEFPSMTDMPDYLDFAYFAFIIGMTAQTADVNIHGRMIRRLALLHGVVAYGFNTAVVALCIGVLTAVL